MKSNIIDPQNEILVFQWFIWVSRLTVMFDTTSGIQGDKATIKAIVKLCHYYGEFGSSVSNIGCEMYKISVTHCSSTKLHPGCKITICKRSVSIAPKTETFPWQKIQRFLANV